MKEELDDDFFHKLTEGLDHQTADVPNDAWDNVASNIATRSFFSFRFTTFNIYYATILVVSVLLPALFFFRGDSGVLEQTVSMPVHEQETDNKLVVPEISNNATEDFDSAKSNQPVEHKSFSVPEVQERTVPEKEAQPIATYDSVAKDADTAWNEGKLSDTAEKVAGEVADSSHSIAKSAVVPRSRFIIQEDTVLNIDTIYTPAKKRKRRR